MKVANAIIAQKFDELADLLEIEGANPFRVRAYRNAARTIGALGKNVADMITAGDDLTDIPGIGKDLAQKIKDIVESGEFALLKETEQKHPPLLSELMKISGLGPKRVKILSDAFHLKSLADLSAAIDSGKILELRGFGKKMVSQIKEGITHHAEFAKTHKLVDADSVAESLLHYMKTSRTIERVDVAGSFRRRKETVGDLDLLATAKNHEEAIKHFLGFPQVESILAKGATRAAVRLRAGWQIDFRVVPKLSYGAALLYFTGSKDHNIALRKIAINHGYKLSEYGLFKSKKSVAGKTEEEVYRAIGLRFIEPELRENRGEIEAAQENKLPKLVDAGDLRGDLHVHTNETDGAEPLVAMVKAASALGYEYVAITDHSKHLTVAKGLNEKRLLQQIEIIDALNDKMRGITILKSIEVDILENGKLDLPDRVLKELDFTVCSIHSRFKLSEEQQTDRIIRAMDNPYFTILGHPTGRLVNRRPPYGVSIEAVMRAARERGCYLELNAQPERLDINDIYCRMAKEMGVKISISSDAHSSRQFSLIEYGIFQARRAWLERADILNTRPLAQLKKLFKRI